MCRFVTFVLFVSLNHEIAYLRALIQNTLKMPVCEAENGIVFSSDDARFYFSGCVNKQNVQYRSETNPMEIGRGITIDSKLEVDPPPSLLVKNSNGQVTLDSSISPQVVKAFYEIHFVPASQPDPSNNGIVTVTAEQKCPFNLYSELCKYYFTPSRIVAVQRIDDLIEKSKGDGTVPVVQGVISDKDANKFMKDVNDTINNKVNAVVSLNKNKTETVPVYKGTVNTQEVLKKPEYPPLPYRPYYPPPPRAPYPWNEYNGWNNCLQPPCPWRTPYSTGILSPKL